MDLCHNQVWTCKFLLFPKDHLKVVSICCIYMLNYLFSKSASCFFLCFVFNERFPHFSFQMATFADAIYGAWAKYRLQITGKSHWSGEVFDMSHFYVQKGILVLLTFVRWFPLMKRDMILCPKLSVFSLPPKSHIEICIYFKLVAKVVN